MKKIIAILILSTLLASCTNTAEENTVETETPVVETEVNTEDETVTEENEVEGEDKEMDNDSDETNNEEKVEDEETVEVNSDDEALESEVNDLLDEFIDGGLKDKIAKEIKDAVHLELARQGYDSILKK